MDSSAAPVYDRIGATYTARRTADPRWEREIHSALGAAQTVINVGAGTGSYEPRDRNVLAVEPSGTMIGQRPPGSAPVVRAYAEDLPVGDDEFDAALAVLTVHHWSDHVRGLEELRRVSRRQVVLAFDAEVAASFWLCDYIPEIGAFDLGRAPSMHLLSHVLHTDDVRPLLVPSDMRDGVLAANWQRPHAYLDPAVRACASGLAQLDQSIVDTGIERLRRDLADGTWGRRYGHLRNLTTFDGGYRLVVAHRV